jgi:hypothetical protein
MADAQMRGVVSHIMAMLLCGRSNLFPLAFAKLLAAETRARGRGHERASKPWLDKGLRW